MNRRGGPGAIQADLDPITLEVITEGLNAIMAEMRGNVMRSAYSSVIGLVQDFSCGLFSPEAELIAQGPDHPGHIVPLPWSVQASMEDLGETLEEGDVILLNDPYRGGTHLNDVTVLWPVFLDGELFCFPAVRAHWADIGGISPGSYTGDATNIFYEGIRIPPIKIYERGELNVSAHRILMSNVRQPEEREGDFRACIGACRVAEARIRALVDRYGRDRFVSAIEANFDRAERRMRARIAELPDGEYFAEDYIEFFTHDRFDPGLIALRLQVSGDAMIADFRRSSPQLPGVVNSTAAVAQGGVLIALKSALDSGGRLNAGTFRPIQCMTNPGTIVSVQYDAPANAHGEVRKRTVSVMLSALSKVVPECVTGDLCGTSFPNVIGGWDSVRSKRFLFLASPSGGNGGFLEADGPDALTNVDMGNLPLMHPTEEYEPTFPIRIEQVALRPDSEGAGRTRGGLGVVVAVRLVCAEAEYSVTSDRAIIPPWGIEGGESSAPILNFVEEASTGDRIEFDRGKVSSYELHEGDLLVMQAAGGGGFGDPLERPAEAVADDVKDGYVTPERARDLYGVILKQDGDPDDDRTARRREELRRARPYGTLVESVTSHYTGIRGVHRVQPLAPIWSDVLGRVEGDLVELVSPSGGAPLRAWLRFDPALAPDSVPLDSHGLALLGASFGDRVLVRAPAVLNSPNDRERRAGSVNGPPPHREGNDMSQLTIGTTLQGVDPPDVFIEHVKQIEAWGYDYLWVTDSSLHARYCYSYLTLAAVNSTHLRLGTNCTHPHTRHPALNANAIATVNEISGGRTILGIGAGDSPVHELGAPLAKVRELEAAVELSRRLYAGERFDYHEPPFTLNGGAIHYGLEGVAPPKIYLTVSGPRMLELAGRVADGVIIHCGAFRDGLEFALSHLKKGADEAGRNVKDIDTAWHLFGVLDDDIAAAREAARPMAAWFPKRSPLYCQIAGMPDELINEIKAVYSGGEFHEAERAHQLTTDEMVDKFTVAGDADVWLERIAMAQELGVSHVELFPMGDRMDLLEHVAGGVIAPLRARR